MRGHLYASGDSVHLSAPPASKWGSTFLPVGYFGGPCMVLSEVAGYSLPDGQPVFEHICVEGNAMYRDSDYVITRSIGGSSW